MARLAGHEGDRAFGAESSTKHLTAATIKAGGQVNGNDWSAGFGNPRDNRSKLIGNRTGEASAEDGVDNHIAGARQIALQRLSCDKAIGKGTSGIAFERFQIA